MELLEIGRIIRPQGLAGRLKVLSYLDSQDVLDGLRELFIGRNAQEATVYPLHAVQKGREFFILTLGGIENKEAASKSVGSSVWMSADVMKKIIGLTVVTEEGRTLGRIESVFPTGSNDVYVCRGSEKEILLPAIGDVILKIDREHRIMVVRLMKGLTES
jgi:16S rRNA processing protein RimM